MMTSDALVSIIVPAYNAEAHLAAAIGSLERQTHKNWEAIVVDDSSVDGTFALAESLAARDPRVRPLRNARAKGVSGARNTGLEAARGDFVCFLDADDGFDPDAIAGRLAGFAASSEPESAWYVPVAMVDEARAELGWLIGHRDQYDVHDFWQNPIHITSPLFRREHLRGHYFPEHLGNGEDWMFMARLAGSGIVYRRAPFGRGQYTIHASSTTKADLVGHARKLSDVVESIYRELDLEQRAMAANRWVPPLARVVSQRKVQASVAGLVRGESVDGLFRAEDFAPLRKRFCHFVVELRKILESEYFRHHVIMNKEVRRQIRMDAVLRRRINAIAGPAYIRHSLLLAISPLHTPVSVAIHAALCCGRTVRHAIGKIKGSTDHGTTANA